MSQHANTADGTSTRENNGLRARILALFSIVFLGLAIIGVIMGLTDKVVFYMNGRDVVESFSPLIVPFIVAILCGILGWIFGFGKWFKNVPVILGKL